jgi:hypothetical protein
MRCSKQDKKSVNSNLPIEMKSGKWKYNDVAKNQVDGHHIDWSYLNIDPTLQMYLSSDDVRLYAFFFPSQSPQAG